MQETLELYPQPCHSSQDEYIKSNVYFDFEEDFVEDNVRCIPMIVRFKLDACGIKLKLSEWSKMQVSERKLLAELKCTDSMDVLRYREYLENIIFKHTGALATALTVEVNPAWVNIDVLPGILRERLAEFDWNISPQAWRMLNNLQRFVLLKLCRPGHENKNFPKAMMEFGLV